MLTESQRREVHTALEAAMGQGPAALMMDALAPVWNGHLARRSDIARVETRIDGLEQKMEAKFERVDARFDAQLARLIQANVLTGFGIAALVLAAAKLA